MSAPTLAATRWVYDFTDGARDMRALLGGKGANVAEMTRILGLYLVPSESSDAVRDGVVPTGYPG